MLEIKDAGSPARERRAAARMARQASLKEADDQVLAFVRPRSKVDGFVPQTGRVNLRIVREPTRQKPASAAWLPGRRVRPKRLTTRCLS